MIKYKRDKTAPLNLFFMLFVSRSVIAFTFSSAALESRYSFDLVYSTLAALAVTAVIALPAVLCVAKGKCVFDNKILGALYGLYFIFSGAINVSKFAVFASAELSQSAIIAVLAGLMILAGAYAASLGIEAISRFGSMVFVLTLISIVALIALGSGEFSYLNIFPITQNPVDSVAQNMLFSVCSTNEIVLYIALAPKINGKTVKPFYLSQIAAYFTAALLIAFTVGVLGDTASLSAYPLFEVAQLSKLGSGERLEVIYTSLWIFAVFLKVTLFIYCAGLSFTCKRPVVKISACAAGVLILSLIFLYTSAFDKNQQLVLYPAFAVFAFILPLFYLIFGKRVKNSENISHN